MTEEFGFGPDKLATPEQQALLDRAVDILNKYPLQELPEEMKAEWQEIVRGLVKAIQNEGYGCQFIHRGWDLMLHGYKLLARRYEPI